MRIPKGKARLAITIDESLANALKHFALDHKTRHEDLLVELLAPALRAMRAGSVNSSTPIEGMASALVERLKREHMAEDAAEYLLKPVTPPVEAPAAEAPTRPSLEDHCPRCELDLREGDEGFGVKLPRPMVEALEHYAERCGKDVPELVQKFVDDRTFAIMDRFGTGRPVGRPKKEQPGIYRPAVKPVLPPPSLTERDLQIMGVIPRPKPHKPDALDEWLGDSPALPDDSDGEEGEED